MPIDLSRILRSDAIIALLAEEDEPLFARLDSRGIMRGEHSISEALRFHIKAFLDHIPLVSPISYVFHRQSGALERLQRLTAPKRKRTIYGITALPAIKTRKIYTCRDATQPLAIVWPSTQTDSHNSPLDPDSPPTCHTDPDPCAFQACTEYDPWITPRERPAPCQHIIWYGAVAALSNFAAEKLCRALLKHNITTLDAPIADTSEARAIEAHILPWLVVAYGLYTARSFICGRYKKLVIHLCKQCVHRITQANDNVLIHLRPWTFLEDWIWRVTEIYHVLETMVIWLEEAVEKMDKSIMCLVEASVPEEEVMTRGEMLPLYRCLVDMREMMSGGAIKGVREDMKTIKHAVGRMMEVVHPLTGLGHDKGVAEALGGLWSVENGEDEEQNSSEDESDDDMEDVDDADDPEKDGDESVDCMDEDEDDITLGYDDESDDSGEDTKYGKDEEKEIVGEDNDAWLASMMDPISDGETEDWSASNDDLEDGFDKEMQKHRPVIEMALSDAAVEVRRVCETWRMHYAFILAIQSGFLNETQDD
ncbi:hypothetical protein QBC40DRAFT_315535 [Triangularia verruculosa]|uniref:Uncharacterized protein n=1 Tax=Triangularia verruculosa TaxID=2587418 RepID=A0AAN6X7V5_9PEZI|nr:hypothetical protein QBC40DRAFT_315535 [Triangularia verruculosa]